ncbi:MAG: amidohydrolase, partial [Candidatus Dormibacteraceae bacterium]
MTKSARFTKAELRRLEVAVGGRPLALKGEDGHSCWGSRAALTAAGISEQTSDVAGGIIERDQAGNVTGILREGACALLTRMRPKLSGQEFEAGLAEVLGELARFGLTTVHSMDGIEEWEALQRLRRQGRLPLRVVSYFRYPELELAAEVRRLVGSDPWLRVGGIKAFLDGTLSSRTAAMVGGGGMLIYQPAELARVARECAQQNFNVGWHAIGDRAVRLALDVLEPMVNTFPGWRPRIEHAQCVRPEDQLRFRAVGAVASMQPAHALSDREVAEREWSIVLSWAYPWNALGKAGVVLAFGSDAPFGDPDPLHGLAAATGWRQEVGWYPELALTRQAALRAYTFGAAYAAGIESEVGRLEVGQRCDLTVIQDGQITATVVEGELVSGRKTT